MAVYRYNYFPDIHEFHNPLSRRTLLERVDRPKAPVKSHYKGEETPIIWCLLDSGADKIVLNYELAQALNIDLSNAPEFSTGVVGGEIIKVKRHPINIIFENRSFSLEADFSKTQPYPILGRTFFSVLDSVTLKEQKKIVELVLITDSN